MSKKFRISGPGAADFLTANGGTDFPETDPSKGTSQTRVEPIVDDAALEPDLDAPDPAVTRERGATPPDRDERRNK
jgi:hypothetical protein